MAWGEWRAEVVGLWGWLGGAGGENGECVLSDVLRRRGDWIDFGHVTWKRAEGRVVLSMGAWNAS